MLLLEAIELFGLAVREMIAPAGKFPGTAELLRATTVHGAPVPVTSTTWFAVAPVAVMPGPAICERKVTLPLASIAGVEN